MATFGHRLRRARETRGWTQRELAARAGVDYFVIYRCERGTHTAPRVDVAARLARTLGVSLDYLAGLYEHDDTDDPAPAALVRAD